MPKFFFTPAYAPNIRIWCEKNGFNGEPTLYSIMSQLSVWGGPDKSGSNFISWELKPINEVEYRTHLKNSGWSEEQFETDRGW